MVKEEIRLRSVILHILDSTQGEPVLSDDCLEFGSELSEFIKEHIANASFIKMSRKYIKSLMNMMTRDL